MIRYEMAKEKNDIMIAVDVNYLSHQLRGTTIVVRCQLIHEVVYYIPKLFRLIVKAFVTGILDDIHRFISR
jgi:hypothetical protein